ncbi:leucyl aminopeptidase [Lonepinella sp. BR2474]|uniref:leucyl aminopeptidase n=1 Tax=Lonepinella sp. BR2474 TaxID=3434548 RepID=UPI003F6DFE23
MKYSANTTALSSANAILLAIFEQGELSNTAKQFDNAGEISALIKCGEISGKIGQISLLRQHGQRLILVGAGKQGEISEREFKQIAQKAIQFVKQTATKTLVNGLTDVNIKDRDLYWNVRFALETFAAEEYIFDQFKSKKSDVQHKLSEIIFHTDVPQAEQAIQHAKAIALGVKIAKDVANCPPNVCTPSYLSEQAKNLEKRTALLTTTVLDEKDMAKLGMNAYLAVSRGSHNEAKLSILDYKNHPNPNAKPIVLVGKGLTFDAGGISLKPAAEMDEMKYDMCGAASVLGVMNALVELQLPLNVIGVLAGCENLPDGNAYRPGDILTTMNGLTVEVLNTDAEGRLVLCDTLTYVERFDPECVIDIATLTGACMIALGLHNSGLVSTNDDLSAQLLQASQQSQDKAWRLPLSEEYQEQLKSNFADLANIGGRFGGAITAGAFLANFATKYPWAHLDIAGTAWLQGANKGATGRPVGLLTQFLINQVK